MESRLARCLRSCVSQPPWATRCWLALNESECRPVPLPARTGRAQGRGSSRPHPEGLVAARSGQWHAAGRGRFAALRRRGSPVGAGQRPDATCGTRRAMVAARDGGKVVGLDRMGTADRASGRRAAAFRSSELDFRVRARTDHVQHMAEPRARLAGAFESACAGYAAGYNSLQVLPGTRPGMWYAIEGYDGEDVLARRQQARPQHLARLTALRDAGRLLLAGPCPAIDAEDPGPAGFSGSIVIAEFDSLERGARLGAGRPLRRSRGLAARRGAAVQGGAALSIRRARCRASSASPRSATPATSLRADLARGPRRQPATRRPRRRPRRPRPFRCRHRQRGIRGHVAAGQAPCGLCRARRPDGDRHPCPVDPGRGT